VIFKAGSRTGPQRSLLTIDDLTWLGQAKFPAVGDGYDGTDVGSNHEGYGGGLAVRYAYNRDGTPSVERLYTIANFSYSQQVKVADLIEYKPTALTTGAIASANTLTIVRRWHGNDWFPRLTDTQWGSSPGAWMGGIYWDPDLTDENGGVLWITIWGFYHATGNYKHIYAVKLSNTIVSGDYATVVQRYGPWEYVGLSADDGAWKEATFGFMPIPTSARAALGGATVAVQGHYTSQSSLEYLQYGPGMRGLSALPTLATGSPWNDGDTISRGTPIMNHASNAASPFGNAKLARFIDDKWMVERLGAYVDDAGTWRNWQANYPMQFGLHTDDAFYFMPVKGGSTPPTNFWVVMQTPCVGGTKAWEYYNGSAWVAIPGSWSTGNANLTVVKNNFVLSGALTGWTQNTLAGFPYTSEYSATNYWLRCRNTSDATTAGNLQNQGVHTPDYANSLNITGYNWYPFNDAHCGLVWVETPTKHGILCFARQSAGYAWYGEQHGWVGSEEVAVNDNDTTETFAVTDHAYVCQYLYPRFYVWDPAQIVAAGGNGNRNNISAPSEGDWNSKWPNIPQFSAVTHLNTWLSNTTFFDPVTNQVIWAPHGTSGTGAAGAATLQVFQV
jgi:hypothetical protein